MQIECIRTDGELADAGLADAWNRLAQSPFCTWDWLEAWWRHFGGAARGGRPGELETLCVRDESRQLVGVAPLYLDRSGWKGRVLRFLGTFGVCSDYLGVVAGAGVESHVAAALADWLNDAGHWDLIELESVDAEDATTRALAAEMKSRGCLINVRPGPSCWRLALPRTWAEYVASLSAAHRKRLRRYDRRMLESGATALRTVERDDQLAAGMGTLIELHQKRQFSLGNSGSFASGPFTEFHREVSRRFLDRGRLRLHWLDLHGRPVAAEYHLAGGRVVYVYQGGIDPLALEHSPGQLATIAALKLAIAGGFAAYDFLRGVRSRDRSCACASWHRTLPLASDTASGSLPGRSKITWSA
jgi:CelD/BcsL family acetyltransferase involved in cellulose biosynthesis